MYCSYHLKFFCLKTKFKVKKNCLIGANEVNVYMVLNLTKIMRYEGYIIS